MYVMGLRPITPGPRSLPRRAGVGGGSGSGRASRGALGARAAVTHNLSSRKAVEHDRSGEAR